MRRARVWQRAALALTSAALLVGAIPAPALGAVGVAGGLDSRGWEMVSPALLGGGKLGTPQVAGAGVFQAASGGESIVFGSPASFGGGAGAPPMSQYLSTRGTGGWTTENLSPPLLSGTYSGGAYQLFSGDLTRGLLSSGWRCRDGGTTCVAENPPLDPAVPAGYRTLYLLEGGARQSLLTTANAPALPAPEDFELSLAGATPDLSHVAISTADDLYLWSGGALTAVTGAPGAELAAPSGAISTNGSRLYWAQAGALHLREGATNKLVSSAGSFQTASSDGTVAFYLSAGHLYRYDTAAETSTDLTPSGGALGVLGASASGSHVYYLTSSGLFLRQGSTVTQVATAADSSNLPSATGTARVTTDGERLAFLSSISLGSYSHAGKSEIYLYEAPANRLLCVSCNPKGIAPVGSATIPGGQAAAEGPLAYKPRALSADGRRIFFNSPDALVAQDTDNLPDVYEWEAAGTGSCTQAAGCLGLISYGASGADSFLDASADGRDAFFLTEASIASADLGGLDVYDARAGGGFTEPRSPIVCEGDGCQGVVLPLDDPPPGTANTRGRSPNPPLRFVETRRKKRHVKKRGKGKRRHGKVAGKHRGGRR